MINKAELCIILPAYNEAPALSEVITSWIAQVSSATENFVMICLDDGSTDETTRVMETLLGLHGPRLEYSLRPNCGHGPTCLVGYREACRRQIPFVLQIDSDGQCLPEYFGKFWELRHDFDVIYGHRRSRSDGLYRKMISACLRLMLKMHGVSHPDANVPYRLMKTEILPESLVKIPQDFHLSNVALSALLEKAGRSSKFVPIDFPPRTTPKPPMRMVTLFSRAAQLHRQLRHLDLSQSPQK